MKPLLYLILLVLSAAAGCRSTAPAASNADAAAFVTLLGADTLAVERFRPTASGMEADVVLRTPRTTVHHYRLDLDDSGALARYEAVVRAPGAAGGEGGLRREVITPVGDSLRVEVTGEGASEVRMVVGHDGMLPFIDMVHWPFELMLRRARAAGAPQVTQDLFTGRNALAFEVADVGGGAMTVTHPFRGTMDVQVDAAGRLLNLDAGATTRKLTVTRVPDVDLEALARRFAAADAAGRAFGALSGRGETSGRVRGAAIRVDYGRPARRGREVFGKLVPWGERWRTGANQATHFETDRALRFGSLLVPAGRYTLYTIPEPDGGTLIINRQTGQGGTTYDESRDLGRVPLTTETLPAPVEDFTIAVEETAAGGAVKLLWDRTAFVAPFTVVE